jgi:hypothetical protein
VSLGADLSRRRIAIPCAVKTAITSRGRTGFSMLQAASRIASAFVIPFDEAAARAVCGPDLCLAPRLPLRPCLTLATRDSEMPRALRSVTTWLVVAAGLAARY